jgi:hypothetical protein
MFSSAEEKGENYSDESKYVAKILSSMSNNSAPVSSVSLHRSIIYLFGNSFIIFREFLFEKLNRTSSIKNVF